MVFILLGASVGALILIGAGLWLLHEYGDLFSYNGLSRNQVANIKKELSKHYTLLSSVKGKTLLGDIYWRGIYLPKQGGIPLYYRYELTRGNGVKMSIYPMLYETWSTNPTILSDKLEVVYP